MADRTRVAVAGLGIGRLHVRAYRKQPEHFEVVAVCDPNETVAQEVAERIGAEALPDVADACARDDIDLVDICTPPQLHADHIRRVLEAGKDAVCEKPLVGSLAAVDAVAALEKSTGRRVMPIFQYRFGAGLQKVKHLVDSGVAGTAYTTNVEVSWRRRADYYDIPWRGRWQTELGGVLLTHAIHAIDMLVHVVGPAARVFARTATRVNPIEVEDCATVSLEMADGSLATLSATLGSAQEISRHRFCFANLSAESATAPYESSSEPWTITPDSPAHEDAIRAALAAFEPGPEGYVGQLAGWARARHDGTEPPVTLADARRAIELVTALYVSAREGREISLPIDPDDPAYRGWTP